MNPRAPTQPAARPPSLFTGDEPAAPAAKAKAKPSARFRASLPDVAGSAPKFGLNDRDYARARETAQQMIDAALADGTHSANARVLGRCGHYCDGLYPGDVCRPCHDAANATPASTAVVVARMMIRAADARRVEPELEDVLILWAREHFPDAAAAWFMAADRRFEDRCLAAIFRARADAEPRWLFAAVERWPKDILRLAPLIKLAAGYATTRAWVDAILALGGTATHAANAEVRAAA